MGSPVGTIRTFELGKQYRIGALRDSERTFREAAAAAAAQPFRALTRRGRALDDDNSLWAVRDVTLDINPGESVGLIGRNGAGKTTLLKLLSRVTTPTAGRAAIYGRVSSLLEVGTGFHQELTGRENIWLNGAILGMRRREIEGKLDEIVEFAEVERFVDLPLKRYSTGMQMRLAFSIAAAVEPDILLVDEVLAVGDASFQKKCLGKMEEVEAAGRTVVFVSHSASAVLRLCKRVVLLDKGRVLEDGPAAAVVHHYLDAGGQIAERSWTRENAPGDDVARLLGVRVRNGAGEVAEALDIREDIFVEVEYEQLVSSAKVAANLHFFNEEGICLFIVNDSTDERWRDTQRPAGVIRCTCRIPGNLLAEGTVYVHAAVTTLNPQTVHALEHDAVAFQVVDSLDGNTARGEYASDLPGVVRPKLDWSISYADGAGTVPARLVPSTRD
jgi:lipopolysaccharide transport system ATP-binding protein